ncbi:VOC family protein [Amycolatopsis jejuensis]|uniref:VOC family protein n=1 Tax=Amycolatopsis jejuensis TaxID=330084 RepID=UPI000524126E|nr:VOC family protein [Amycolatopsis jejuensis]
MTVLGVHHFGLSVADLGRARAGLAACGFTGGPAFELTGADAARGNGLESVRMRVAFVGNGPNTLELIEHLDGTGTPGPAEGDSGFQRWPILPGGADCRLPGVSAAPIGEGPAVTVTARDIEGTSALLRSIGVRELSAGRFTAPGVTVAVERATAEQAAPPVTAVGRSHLAFQVDDAQATYAQLVADGFECVSEPIAHGEAVWWFFVRDPGGSGEIEVVEDITKGPADARTD